ncbi:replicase helicase endonuclease [Labeo rohita]|uniref:Replicase helicase endonuclease n=1 Tax=Labeo rohita TaxID=84645 RepID=A0A498L452_LABRO|nr:replicase helicase endonuclease [Labeo rohita]
MHSRNHSKSCRKNKKHCRFGFPKPPLNRTTITRPRPPPVDQSDEENGSEERDYASVAKEQLQKVWDLLNDSNHNFETITQLLNQANLTYEQYEKHIEALSTSSLIVMERRPQDCWVNGYNPMLLRAWNANMDIQFILNPYSCIMYMLSYISKAEHEMSDYLKRVIKDSSHDNLSERECMKQVMNAYSKNREVSAQEAVARTCSLKLKSSSRAVIFIPTDDNAVKMSLPIKYLQTMDDDVENVWMTGLPDKYKARPNRPEFENMCMAEFASEYRIVYGRQKRGKHVLPLQQNMGHIQKRTRGKPAVIRFARFSQQKNPEKFYGTLLKLYLPYRRDEQLKSTRFQTYESFYAFASVKLPGTDELQRVFSIVNTNRDKYEKHNEAIEQAIEDFEKNGPVEDAWTTLAPANELIRLESLMEREPTDPNEVNEQEDIPEYTASTSVSNTAMPLMEAAQLNHAQIRKMYQSLNQTQASVFYAVRDWCKKCISGESPQPFLHFLNGGAGVGSAVPAYLHLDGYTMYKRNRHASYTNYVHLANKNGGGVAIYVKNSFQVCPLMYMQNVTDLEYLVLKIEAPKQALIAVIYRPPSYNLAEFLANLNALLTSLEIIDFKPVIVCGDFNEDQLSRCNKPILNLFEDKGYTQLISTGTTENNTLLDPVFISGTQSNVRAGVLQTYYSYHDPVYCVSE